VNVAEGDTTELLPLTLPEVGGVVLQADPEVCSGAVDLRLRRTVGTRSTRIEEVARTDVSAADTCRWPFEGLRPGRYEATLQSARKRLLSNVGFEVAAHQIVPALLSSPRVEVTGRVTVGGGKPPVPLWLLFTPREGLGEWPVETEADGSFEAEGGIRSGDGSLRITGTQAESGMALSLKGSKFLAANIPGARLSIAPDLALTGKLDAMRLNGAVTIENADVNLENLSIAP